MIGELMKKLEKAKSTDEAMAIIHNSDITKELSLGDLEYVAGGGASAGYRLPCPECGNSNDSIEAEITGLGVIYRCGCGCMYLSDGETAFNLGRI